MVDIQNAHKLGIISYLLASAVLGLLIFVSISHSYYLPLSFDGAFNTQVSLNIMKFGRYATSYDHYIDFDHIIQTGSPFLIAQALSFSLFGITLFAAQLPNAIYLISLGLIIFAYVRRLSSNNFFALFALLFFITTPFLYDFGLHGYGEIPALFFFLSGILLFEYLSSGVFKANIVLPSFAVGVLFALAYLTKTIILVIVPPLLSVFILDVMFFRKLSIKAYASMGAGFLSSIAVFESFKLYSLGFIPYLHWWKIELFYIFKTGASSEALESVHSFLRKVIAHGEILSNAFDIPMYALFFLFFAPYAAIIVKYGDDCIKKRYHDISLSILALVGSSLTYMAWWIFMIPTAGAWARRIMNGIIIHETVGIAVFGIIISYLVIEYKGKVWWNRSTMRFKNLALIVLGGIAMLSFYAQLFRNIPQVQFIKAPHQKIIDATEVVESIASLPETAKIYGIGWWQAPLLSFLSGRMFYDIETVNLEWFNSATEHYVAVDQEALAIAPETVRALLARADVKSIKKKTVHYRLYKIDHLYPQSLPINSH